MTLTHDMIGLPEELFEAMKHMVFTHEVRRVPQFYIKRVPNYVNGRLTKDPVTGSFFRHEVSARLTAPITRQLPQYGLNAMRDLIHEFNHQYMGQDEDGDLIFFRDEVKFIKDGRYYFTPADEKVLTLAGTSRWLEGKDPESYRAKLTYSISVNGVTTRYNIDEVYTAEQVAAMLNITPEQFEQEVYVRWIGEFRNPDTHITSVLNTIERLEDVGFFGRVFINGETVTERPNKISIDGTVFDGYKSEWHFYNDCTAQTANSGTTFAGEHGKCAEIINVAEFKEVQPVSFDFDLTRKNAFVKFYTQESGLRFKRHDVETYMDVHTGQLVHESPKQIGDGVTML